MTLAATSSTSGNVLGLLSADCRSKAIRRRLHAPKHPRYQPVSTPGKRITSLCNSAIAHRRGAIAVFV